MNDAWYASAFWSAFNLEVNREYFKVSRVRIFEQMEDMVKHPVMKNPIKIAETEGEQIIEVYQGDFRQLHSVIPPQSLPVTAIDIFDKGDSSGIQKIKKEWGENVGGDLFIP
jgi:hypothetical protein